MVSKKLGYVEYLLHFYLFRSLIKSVGMFALGIKLARECMGVEILPGV